MSEEGENGKRSREEDGATAEDASEPPAKAVKADGENGSAEVTPAEESTAAEADSKGEESKADGETKAEESKESETKEADNNDANKANGEAPEAPPPTPAAVAPEAAPVAAQPAVPAPAPEPVQQAPAPALPPGLPPAMGGPQAAAPAAVGYDNAPVNPHAPATLTNPSQMVEERGEVSSLYVGRVIGKGGEMIRDLQARSGCRIDVDQSVPPGQPRIITYRGTRKTVDFAKHLVNLLCQEHVNESDLPLGEAKREIMAVPATAVGKIIGRGGEMIRELQSRSHAKIQVDHNNQGSAGLPENQKRLTITGNDLSVTKAKEMVNFLVANPMMDAMQGLNMLVEDKLHRGGVWGSGPPYINLPNNGQNMMPHMMNQNPYGAPAYDQAAYGAAGAYPQQPPMAPAAAQPGYPGMPQQPAPAAMPYPGAAAPGAGGSEMEMFFAARNFMGRIIGQKGVTINDLQRRSGCDIQINQDVPHGQDCEISIRGARQGIEMAKQMLREIIEIGPNHPYAGGAGAAPSFGGGFGQDSYGQAPQQAFGYGGAAQPAFGGYQQQPAYGYDQQQAIPQAYGQQPQQPIYGGAPMYGGGMPGQQAYPGYGAAPQPPPGASPWKSATAADGQVYYYNEKTGETQWEKPPGMP